MINFNSQQQNSKLYSTAAALALFTICYNIIEGIVSVSFGIEDSSVQKASSKSVVCGCGCKAKK